MIEVQKISFFYTATGAPIFDNFSWEIKRSEAWAVVGPSGCGKTTLLYMLSGLLRPNRGTILIDDIPVLRPRPQSGLILQDYGLLPWATVRQNCELGLKIRKLYGADGIHAPQKLIKNTSNETWLKKLGLEELGDKYPGQLSGGQRQRTAIARTLNLEPDLLLMDEPFSSLDVPTRENLQDLIHKLIFEFGITLILVTHSIEESVYLGKKILLLKNSPNEKPIIFDNPEAGSEGYRNSIAFLKFCQTIRQEMSPS
jgi:ABC-type nitrate/sulfonate/bicarbonate transport system ATPase subunit